MSEAKNEKTQTVDLETRALVTGRTIGLITAALILYAVVALFSDTLVSEYTTSVLLRQVAFFSLIALAQAVCLVVGGMNLSVGAMGSLCSVVLGEMVVDAGMSGWVAVPLCLSCGALVGMANGFLIVKLKINSFIVTLSTMFVMNGMRSAISMGEPYAMPASFTAVGQGTLFSLLPYSFLVVLLAINVLSYLYRGTVFGRRMLATGGNADAARLSGISNDNMILGANTLSGILAALAAILYASEMGTAAPSAGESWLIVTFAVAIIGGTGLQGGVISPYGILMGGVIYTLIRHGLIDLDVNPYYMNIYVGALILLTITVDRVREVWGKGDGRP